MLIGEWVLSSAATLGSSVRARGILLEIRARLAPALKKRVEVKGGVIVLAMPSDAGDAFSDISAIVSNTLNGIESMPVIPREIEDILSISTTERHRWLKDGRLPSAGTRTVKLRGRAREITFHVFDPRLIEDVLDRDLVASWREDDAATAIENRRRAAWNRRLARAPKVASVQPGGLDEPSPGLVGWDEFAREGLLR